MARTLSVIMAVLSVSAPVPAVVGTQISGAKAPAAASWTGSRSKSKDQRSKSLRATRLIALPASMPLPPPMATTPSWPPAR
jgi:hypothetical protein